MTSAPNRSRHRDRGPQPTVADRGPVHGSPARKHIEQRIEVGAPRKIHLGPFDTETCAIDMGVVVDPGPEMPPTSPAITRIRAPASEVVARPT